MRVYLADLGHNLLTFSSDTYPLGVANLATYTQAYLRSDEPLHVSIFREPQDLKAALDDTPPDILGLSNYTWNEELAYQFCRYAKRLNPETLVVMGGPNFPLVDEVKEQFLRNLPDLDGYIDGPTYEGERAFLNLVQRYVDVGKRREGVFDEPVPGNCWIHPKTGAYQHGGEVPRIRDLDEIPSPYLAGLMDPYFKTGYFPLMQIARGCPFTCQFCNSSVLGNSKIYAHSVENVKQDLLYIAERVDPSVNLCFADDNFAMYQRDEEIAEFIGWLQDEYKWPKYIRTTTGKNQGERIIRVMRKIRGALPMTSAVQSLNPVVLENIKRSNIKLDTYAELQEELIKQGMQSYGELILCLPGETRQSIMDAIEKLLDAGSKRVSAHQLMLLHGAPLANPDSRAKFGFDTRFRVVARNIGDYLGEPIIEVEEMVVETPDFSFQDYLDTRVFHLLLTIFFYEGNFDEPFRYADQHGVKPFDLVVHMQSMLDRAPAAFTKVIDDFLVESQAELFRSREECLAWAKQNYDALVDGTLGGNLLSKYSMLGRFYATAPALEFLTDVVRSAVEERGSAPVVDDELRSVMEMMHAVVLHVPFDDEVRRETTWTSAYDVASWAAASDDRPLSAFRADAPVRWVARTEPDKAALIRTKVKTFGEHPHGLGKFTRTMFARDLRRSLVREPVPELATV